MLSVLNFILSLCLGVAGHSIPERSLEQFKERVSVSTDTLYVVNFWATWCKPCIAEIPYFEQASEDFSDRPVKILLASLDFPDAKSSVEKFIANRSIKNEAFLLNAGNPNKWIDEIDSSWSGAIPATVFYRGGRKVKFNEGDFNLETLKFTIESLLNKP